MAQAITHGVFRTPAKKTCGVCKIRFHCILEQCNKPAPGPHQKCRSHQKRPCKHPGCVAHRRSKSLYCRKHAAAAPEPTGL